MARQPTTDRTASSEIAKLWEAIRQLRNRSSLSGTAITTSSTGTGTAARQLARLLGPAGVAGNDVQITGPGAAEQRVTTVRGILEIPGGSVLLVDGGDVVMKNTDGIEVLRLGVQQFGDRGFTLARESGAKALQVRKIFAASDPQQVFQILDREGRVIGGDAGLSPRGFDAPHMHLAFIPTDYDSSANAQSTSSTSFVATHEHRGFFQNPFFRPQFMVKCSAADTAGEIQIWDVLSGVYLQGFLGGGIRKATIPTGTTAYTLFELNDSIQLNGSMSDWMHLQIHVRRTAGTGSITVAPVRTVSGNVNN